MFDRRRQQIQLTEAGLLFVSRARELLARGDKLEREVIYLRQSRRLEIYRPLKGAWPDIHL